jgi:hypothetical protein
VWREENKMAEFDFDPRNEKWRQLDALEAGCQREKEEVERKLRDAPDISVEEGVQFAERLLKAKRNILEMSGLRMAIGFVLLDANETSRN